MTPAAQTAATDLTNYGLALTRLKASAEDTYQTLQNTPIFDSQVTPNFQAAIQANNAYYKERIRQTEAALAKETQGTEEYNTLETRIFELRRQRLIEEQRLQEVLSRIQIERTRSVQRAEQNALREISNAYQEYRQILTSVIEIQRQEAFGTFIETLRQQGLSFREIVPHAREYAEFLRQIAAIPRASSPDAQFGRVRTEIERTTESGRTLLSVLREVVQFHIASLDLDARIPIPEARDQAIDAQIAEAARGQQTLADIRQQALQQGREYLQQILTDEERDLQRSITDRARQYRQYANSIANLFTGLATGRIDSFEEVARQFIAQSLRIITRAFIEYQIQKRLDDTLTASKIANIQKVNKVSAAQQAAGLAGNLAGIPANIPGLSNISNLLAGGGLALGVSGLLFRSETSNLLNGIQDGISGFLENVGGQQEIIVRANIQKQSPNRR